MSRFIAARGSRGSVCIRDTARGNRMCCTFDRNFAGYGSDRDRADKAAMRMAEICAEALNRVHEEAMQAKQQKEGGK